MQLKLENHIKFVFFNKYKNWSSYHRTLTHLYYSERYFWETLVGDPQNGGAQGGEPHHQKLGASWDKGGSNFHWKDFFFN